MITLRPKVDFKVPVEAPCISPDSLAGKSRAEAAKLPVLWGNKEKTLGDLFRINAGGGTPDHVVVDGDVSAVKHMGARMTRGKLTIKGDAGMHLGREMDGGEISVSGNAGDWAGAEMGGGIIHIKGSTGDLAGSAYRGSSNGMKGGALVVDGNAGTEVGELMKGGSIAVKGDLGSFAGALMSGVRNLLMVALPPLAMCDRHDIGGVVNASQLGQTTIILYDRYEGDLANDGKGRIIVWKSGPPRPEQPS